MLFDKYIDGGWALAIRKNYPGKQLYSSNDGDAFSIIKNPWGYWCADPFLFNHKGTEYIFCEAFDIFQNKGIIAYRIIDDQGRVSKLHPCLECEGHLSYPYIFAHDNQVYMVPESGDANEIALYKATRFPDEWEKIKTLVKNVAACDTNMVKYRNQAYLMTLIYDKNKVPYKYDSLYLYHWDGCSFKMCGNSAILCDAEYARNGGKMFFEGETLYRISQNCMNMYGENLDFHIIDRLSETGFEEHFVKRVSLSDISVNDSISYEGIHTYDHDERYEIVDLQRVKWFRIERFLFLIRNKIRRKY